MTLEQIAQEAMDYLDSVGVAADWDIEIHKTYSSTINVLYVCTDLGRFNQIDILPCRILNKLKNNYPQSKERQ